MTGLVTIVTGASRGIGAAIALKLASLGAQIVVNYASNDKAAASIVGAIAEKHGPNKAIAVKADVSVEADCKRVVQTALEAFGRIDVLVNNAAIAKNTPLVDESLEIHDRIMAVNVNGTYLMTRAVVPVMSNGGSIIIISSTISKAAIKGYSSYAMSKGAIECFARCLAEELAPNGIRVNIVSPGMTDTDMLRSASSAAKLAAYEQMPILKRLGTPEDIAESVAFLTVPRSGAWMTGQNLLACGGLHLSH